MHTPNITLIRIDISRDSVHVHFEKCCIQGCIWRYCITLEAVDIQAEQNCQC